MDVASVSLIVAAMDLKVVRLLRDAMRTADLSSGACRTGPLGTVQRPDVQPRPKLRAAEHEPRADLAPRPVVHPAPRFEPRPVVHPRPVEMPPALLPPVCPEHATVKRPFIQPPWKVLPWENPPQPVIPVKVRKPRPDIVRKGTLIDCFM